MSGIEDALNRKRKSMARREVDQDLEALAARWGRVYMAYYPDYESDGVILRNKTDEGLPTGGEKREARGDTFEEALENALAAALEEDDDEA